MGHGEQSQYMYVSFNYELIITLIYRLHVGVTYDISTGKQSIHLNGVLEEYQSGVTPLEGSRKIYITATDGVELSNLQLWSSCLSEVAIRETMKVPWNAKSR